MSRFFNELQKIKDDALKVSELTKEGISWFDKRKEARLLTSKIDLLDDNIRKLNRVISASDKRPSIAVFGQSQVGKSFLVRTLAQSATINKLQVLNADGTIDFIQKINPPGGRESTGIITRFTTKRCELINERFPFKIELLNQLDIAAIITNGYIEDIKDYENDFDNESILDELFNIVTEKNKYEDIHRYDIKDFKEFLWSNYREDYRIRDLKSIGFFDILTQKLQYIPYDKRYKILEFLWGKNEFLTKLFNLLSETLKEINFSKIAYLNEGSIINDLDLGKDFSLTSNVLDVERIKEIFKANQLPSVDVCTINGTIKSVSRSILCALIKELQFEIPINFETNSDRDFLLHSDLLDFPGSKSREKIPEKVFITNSDTEKLSLFVRGKVSYLFFLYNRDIGISTLLYCMDNEPPLVADSPALLEKWVSKYVGNSPQQRNQFQSKVLKLLDDQGVNVDSAKFSPLLVAMTKFNIELAGKGDADIIGEPSSHDSKWFARFKENFSAYMNKPVSDKWTENWTDVNGSFNFLFPIRDPNFSTSIFDGYELNGSEISIRPEKIDKLNDMRVSFLASPVVDRFIIDKEAIWNEIITPNQTGINYLCKFLSPSAHPANLIAQLRSLLNDIVNSNVELLESEYFSGNMEEDMKNAKLKAAQAFTAVLSLNAYESKPLVDFFDTLIVSETEIWKLLYEFRFSKTIEKQNNENELDHSALKNFLDTIGINFNDFDNTNQVKEALLDFYSVSENDLNVILENQIGFKISDFNQESTKPKNTIDGFCDIVIDFWTGKINNQTIENTLHSRGVNKHNIESVKLIANEITKSKNITLVRDKIKDILRDRLNNETSKDSFNVIASCICSLLNKYTFSVSWSFVDDGKKPTVAKLKKEIFENISILNDSSVLTTDLLKVKSSQYLTNFSIGVKEIFIENVKLLYNLKDDFDVNANSELESILGRMKIQYE